MEFFFRRILTPVKVAVLTRNHNHIMTFGCCNLTGFLILPGHKGRIWRDSALKHLVPTDQATTIVSKELLHCTEKIAMKLVEVRKALFFQKSLTVRTILPISRPIFITSEVDVFRREDFHHLCKDILQNLDGALFSNTHFCYRSTRIRGTCQLRKRSNGGQSVTRHLNFRNYRNVTLFGIGHKFPHIIFRVVSAISPCCTLTNEFASGVIELFPSIAHSPCAILGKIRIFLYLDSPSLVISQMQMQSVELQCSHHADLLFHEFF